MQHITETICNALAAGVTPQEAIALLSQGMGWDAAKHAVDTAQCVSI